MNDEYRLKTEFSSIKEYQTVVSIFILISPHY
jgi:hypothetical protein